MGKSSFSGQGGRKEVEALGRGAVKRVGGLVFLVSMGSRNGICKGNKLEKEM